MLSKSKLEQKQILTLLVKGGGFAFIGLVISKIASYIARLIVARIGPEQYGLLSLALVIFSFSAFIALFGFSDCIVRYVSYFYNKKDYPRLKGAILFPLKFTFSISVLIGASLFIFSDWISLTFFHDIRLSVLLKVFAFVIPFDVIRNDLQGVLLAFKKVKGLMIAKNLTENVSKVLILTILILLGYGLIGATIAYGLAIFLSALVSFYYFRKLESYKLISSNVKAVYLKKEMLAYALPLLFTSIVFFFIGWTDTFMIGYFKNAYDVGIYNAAYPTAYLMWLFPSSILMLALPIMTELYTSKNKEAFNYLLKKIIKWIFTFNLILVLIFSFFASEILSVLFGSQYASGNYVLIILSVSFFIFYISQSFENVFLTLNKTKIILYNAISAASLNIVLNYILIPKMGILGAAIGTGISLLLIASLRAFESYFFLKTFHFDKSFWKILLSGFIALAITKLFVHYTFSSFNILALIFVFSSFIIVYACSLLLSHFLDKDEFDMFIMFQKKLGIQLEFLNRTLLKLVKK